MAKFTKAATKQVLKALTSVRATLNPEEQKILDSIVVFQAPDEVDEVAAHKMLDKAQTKAQMTKAQATKSAAINIFFDAESGEYRQQI